MLAWIALLPILLCALPGATDEPQALQIHPAPLRLEELQIKDATGQPVALRGPAVVNIWATWCAPCVAEMPSLDRLRLLLRTAGIDVLPISLDRGGAPVVQDFYARYSIANLPVLLDSRAGLRLRTRGLPTTILIDSQGREVARLEGAAAWDHPDMVQQIRQLLIPIPDHRD